MTVFSAALLLFLVMDPFGNIPFFIIAIIIILSGGKYLLPMLQISKPSLTIAGGIILFLIAINMIFPALDGGMYEEKIDAEPFIVPLAIPYVAGPSTFAAHCLL